jgi:hypothetical protein
LQSDEIFDRFIDRFVERNPVGLVDIIHKWLMTIKWAGKTHVFSAFIFCSNLIVSIHSDASLVWIDRKQVCRRSYTRHSPARHFQNRKQMPKSNKKE